MQAAEDTGANATGERQSTRRVFIGLGGNLGNPSATFDRVLEQLNRQPEMSLTVVSARYRTAAWGGQTTKPFINRVAEYASSLDCHQQLDVLTSIEHALGRRRTRETRWADRFIDLDLLAAGEEEMSRPGLQVPHPRIALRRFVLVPWAEIAPDFIVPGYQLTVEDLLKRCSDSGLVEPLEGIPWNN